MHWELSREPKNKSEFKTQTNVCLEDAAEGIVRNKEMLP